MTRYWALCAGALALTVAAGAALGLGVGRARPQPAIVSSPHAAPYSPARIALTPGEARKAIADGELDRNVKSILRIDHGMNHGDFIWNEANVPDGPVWIRIDLERQLISIFRAGHEIGTAVTLYGANDKATPKGHFRVLWKHKDHHSATYDAPMPYTLRLTDDGIAIHGSQVMSGRATHGCIGVPIEFARHLFETASKGDEVVILG